MQPAKRTGDIHARQDGQQQSAKAGPYSSSQPAAASQGTVSNDLMLYPFLFPEMPHDNFASVTSLPESPPQVVMNIKPKRRLCFSLYGTGQTKYCRLCFLKIHSFFINEDTRHAWF
jgi:hypothetical protein